MIGLTTATVKLQLSEAHFTAVHKIFGDLSFGDSYERDYCIKNVCRWNDTTRKTGLGSAFSLFQLAKVCKIRYDVCIGYDRGHVKNMQFTKLRLLK